jgi:PAS domain S-box-containing protein
MYSVLYVDDEPGLLEIGKLFLEQSGQFSVDTITSATAALDLLNTRTFDAIISDYQMPDIDGINFLKKVRASGNTIPFILFTGRGREEVVIQALNEGADFYLQKGGEPVSQFTELAHQIRQAVQQRRAEISIRDLERREADIINFLPDATFAIDRSGCIIAWNRAIEEMTGVTAAEMLGKGDYEYAVPFYGQRQPILIDLISESDEVIARKYAHIIRDKDILIADTPLPRPMGKSVTLLCKAGPLYDRQGRVVGAIESIRDITERKKAEDRLSESEERYRNVVEDQTEFISRFLPDGTHVFVNEAYCRYFGLKRDEILGHRFRPAIPAEDRERVNRFFESLTPDHPVSNIEHRIIMPDGSLRWQRWSDRAIFDPSGKLTEYQSVGRDITEYYLSEEYLARISALKQELLGAAPLEEKLKRITDFLVELFGVDFARIWISGRGDLCDNGCIHAPVTEGPHACRNRASCLHLVVSSGRYTHTDGGHRRVPFGAYKIGRIAGGEDAWFITNDVTHDPLVHDHEWAASLGLVSFAGFRLVSAEGKPVGVLALFSRQLISPDITGFLQDLAATASQIVRTGMVERALRETEEKIRGSEEFLRRVITGAKEGIIVYDRELKIRLWNRFMEEMTGLQAADVQGKNALELFPFHKETGNDLLMMQALEGITGVSSDFEFVIPATGNKGWAKSIFSPDYDAHGTIIGVIGIVRNITERKHAEEFLRKSEARLKRAEEVGRSGSWEFLLNENAVEASDGARSLYGLEGPHWTIDEVQKIPLPGYRPLLDTALKDLIAGTAPYNVVFKIRRQSDGAVRDIHSLAEYDPGRNVVFGVIHDITGRKQAEEALRESEARYRSILSASPDVIAITDPGGRISMVSPSALKMFGYAREEEPLGQPIAGFLVPEDRDRAAANIALMERGVFTGPGEYRAVRTDGSTFDIEVNGEFIRDAGGQPAGMVFIVRDISGRKQAEDLTKTTLQRFETLISNLYAGVAMVSEDGTIEHINQALCDLYHLPDPPGSLRGLTSEELIGKIAGAYASPEEAVGRIRDLITRGEPVRGYEVVMRDGRTVMVDYIPILDRDGKRQGRIWHHQDITGRKRMEDALRESEEKYRRLISDSFDAVVVHQDGRIVLANGAAVRILGAGSPSGLVGRPILDLVHPEFRDTVAERVRQLSQFPEGTAPLIEEKFVRSDGTAVDAEVMATATQHDGRPAVMVMFRDITERRRVEDALRESEEKYRLVVEHSQDAIYIHRSDRILFANTRASELTGYTHEELMGIRVWDLVHPDDRAGLVENAQNRFAGEDVPPGFTARLLTKDGLMRTCEFFVNLVVYQGAPAILGIARDITERVRAADEMASLQQRTAESQQMLQQVLNTVPVRVFWKDTDLRYLGCNVPFARDAGFSAPAGMIGKDDFGMGWREQAERYRADDRKVIRTGVPEIGYEEPQTTPDGNRIWVRTSKIPLRDRDGTITGVLGTYEDITERKQAEESLRESEEKYRHILENLQDAYFRADRDGNLSMAGPSAARVYGYGSPEEMAGIPAVSLYGNPRHRDEMLRLLERDGKVSDFTVEARRRDGSLFWASISVQYLTDGEGRRTGTETVVRDISGRRAMEHAIQEANRKLNLLNAITRHDVTNQLTVLQGYVQLASMKKPDPVVADFLQNIHEAAATIERQIAFTRVYQELGVQAPAWFTLGDVVAKAPGTAVPVRFSGTCRAVSVLADPMVERVFFNLFENAVRHGKRVSGITVRCERDPDGLLVIVEDDGVGVKPHEKEKIFTKGYGKNTGFGLFLAREILAITGITIRETGSSGRGARFEMLVPRGAFRLPEGKGKKE